LTARIIWGTLALVGSSIVTLHHAGYLRRTRPITFGAFLGTAGWIVITLVAIAASGGGMAEPETRIVEIASGAVGILLIGVGGKFR
jgi:threonine/homoserine/homoserine lactone efflux protein